jgi:nitrogen regulatory protein P-II 1
VEIVVKDSQVKALTEAIIEVCRSEKVGDGKIFVSSIENATRIRTGESGDAAIS